jgi:hypothetical protein
MPGLSPKLASSAFRGARGQGPPLVDLRKRRRRHAGRLPLGPDSSTAALSRALGRPLDGLETPDRRRRARAAARPAARSRRSSSSSSGRSSLGVPSRWRSPPARICAAVRWWAQPDTVVLELAPPGATLQLEVKAHADPALARRTARALCERLRDHAARERTEVISFWSGARELPPSSAFGRGWSSSPTTASTRSRPGGDASASTAYASGTSSSRARWSRPSERPDSASRPARSTTPQCSSRSCRLASTPSQATPRSSQARAVSRPRMKGTLAANMLVGHG